MNRKISAERLSGRLLRLSLPLSGTGARVCLFVCLLRCDDDELHAFEWANRSAMFLRHVSLQAARQRGGQQRWQGSRGMNST